MVKTEEELFELIEESQEVIMYDFAKYYMTPF